MNVGVALVAVVIVLAVVFVIMFLRSRSSGGDSWESRSTTSPAGGRARPASGQRINWLVGQSAGVQGKTFHVGTRTATIGRGLGNLIQISDENASKVHAQFVGSASGLQIKDMNSSNGTRVNGELLEADTPRPLGDGDEIAIGDTIFVYRRAGNFQDQALTGKKDVQASQQKQTMALGAIGGGGDLKSQIEAAVAEAGGDYEKAAEKVGLDAEMIKRSSTPTSRPERTGRATRRRGGRCPGRTPACIRRCTERRRGCCSAPTRRGR